MKNLRSEFRITRRAMLGAGAMLTLPFPRQFAKGESTGTPLESDLFVFRAPNANRLVLAVTHTRSINDYWKGSEAQWIVRIHANARTWTIGSPALEPYDVRVFDGIVIAPGSPSHATRRAVVLELPPDFVRHTESQSVWAEILAANGSRFRVGSPFLSEILRNNPELSKRYHSSSPTQDETLLADALAGHLASIAATEGEVADPHAHGCRMAAHLLPDVIRYDPSLPVGFNFASQNGRHPCDETAAFVSTVLTGSVNRQPISPAIRLQPSFPYFLNL